MGNRVTRFQSSIQRLSVGIVLLVPFLTVISAQVQKGLIPEKYLKVIPGSSNRADVEKVYLKHDSKRDFVTYYLPDLHVDIQYSRGPCTLGLSEWGLPEWTVEEIRYGWPKGTRRIPLREILLKPKQFAKRQLGDVVGHDYYVNDEFGIMVVYDRQAKSVVDVVLKPPASLRPRYACRQDKE